MTVSNVKNIAEHMSNLAEAKDQLFKYFYWDSKLWKAICNHIYKARPCVLIDKEKYPIAVHRGTGPAIQWKKVYCYKDYKQYTLEFTITYENDDENEEFSRHYYLSVPIDLEENFTDVGFDIWCKEMAEQQRDRHAKRELPELERLIKKYPEQAKAFCGDIPKDTIGDI